MNVRREIRLIKKDYDIIGRQLKDAKLGGRLTSLLKILLDAAEDPKRDPQVEGNPPLDPRGGENKKNRKDYWNAKGEDGLDVRTDIANLRKALERRVWNLSGDRECSLTIPNRDQTSYRVVAQSPSGLERLWLPHARAGGNPSITLHERLFFRYKNDVYIRSTNVNHEGTLDRLAIELPQITEIMRELNPSRHYVSSGELHGAIALQNFMFDHLAVRARIRMHQGTPGLPTNGNEVILAASRVDDPDLEAETHEAFTASETGVDPGYRDDIEKPPSRIIHVLLSRRSYDGAMVKTILQGSHGRAVQGVCEYLGLPDSCDGIVEQLGIREKKLPEKFQMVFQVMLTYEQRAQISRPSRVTLCAWAKDGVISPIQGRASFR